jgi:hypothetical protein
MQLWYRSSISVTITACDDRTYNFTAVMAPG